LAGALNSANITCGVEGVASLEEPFVTTNGCAALELARSSITLTAVHADTHKKAVFVTCHIVTLKLWRQIDHLPSNAFSGGPPGDAPELQRVGRMN
jgi:hypothetical protein